MASGTGEFDLIRRYFHRPQAGKSGVTLGIGDDCALLAPTPGMLQAISVDTSIAGVHFPPDANPADIGFRALTVSLSDLAAMGATARWCTLALTLPSAGEAWLEAFSYGFFEAAEKAGVVLVGGDTTRGPLSITVQVQGEVPAGQALLRSGAKEGDYLYVSCTLGDAGAGLAVYQKHLEAGAHTNHLLQAYLRPEPELATGIALRGIASSCIDISDGLLADLGHILESSAVGAEIDLAAIPLSAALLACYEKTRALELALTAGDDYRLCFSAPLPPDSLPVPGMHCFGRITAKKGIAFRNRPAHLNISQRGFDHFHE